MSDNRIHSNSSFRANNIPESSELPAKPSGTSDNPPRIFSGSSVDASKLSFAQEKEFHPLSQRLSVAIRLQSVPLIHALLSEAILKRDVKGLADVAKYYDTNVQGKKIELH